MKTNEAAAQIAKILLTLSPRVDHEDVCAKAISAAKYTRDRDSALVDWPRYNAELAEEGKPALSWTEYLEFAAECGEWAWPIEYK